MTHDEVFTFFKAMCPQMATKEVLCWYPCGANTIRLVMAKDKREFCFTVGDSSTRDYHMRLYSEWLKEEFPEDPDAHYKTWRVNILDPNYKADTSAPYERNYPYEEEVCSNLETPSTLPL